MYCELSFSNATLIYTYFSQQPNVRILLNFFMELLCVRTSRRFIVSLTNVRMVIFKPTMIVLFVNTVPGNQRYRKSLQPLVASVSIHMS